MERLILKNFRCFRDVNVRLAPVTLLIGENSTGKTSFLAGVRLAWDATYGFGPLRFFDPPYDLGRSLDVVTKGQSEFTLGLKVAARSYSVPSKVRDEQVELEVTFEPGPDEVTATRIGLRIPNSKTVHFERSENGPEWTFSAAVPPPGKGIAPVSLEMPRSFGSAGNLLRIFDYIPPGQRSRSSKRRPIVDVTDDLFFSLRFFPRESRPYAFAPVRSAPERDFSLRDVQPSPDGSHFPQVLVRLLDSPKGADLKTELVRFGEDAHLFQGISVKQPGKDTAFQIRIRLGAKQDRNIVDVGYGVSQILPVLTEVINSETRTFLIQQPEVHLHPRAQAAFGSFAGRVAKTRGKQLIIETHSDYILDRLCMDVRDKVNGLTPDDVNILYFERNKKGDVEVHEIGIDETGNLTNVPKGYRAFFLQEQKEYLFGRDA